MSFTKPVNDQPTKSIIYETSRTPEHRRVLIDRQSINLHVDAVVKTDIDGDGSGWLHITLPAGRVQVIEAGNRVTKRRPSKPKREEAPATPVTPATLAAAASEKAAEVSE